MWITWDELLILSAILIVLIITYASLHYEDVEASFSSLFERTAVRRQERQRKGYSSSSSSSYLSTHHAFPENNMRTTIAEHSIIDAGDDFLQLVEEYPAMTTKTTTKDDDSDGDPNAEGDETRACPNRDHESTTTTSTEPPQISFDDFTQLRPHLCSDGKTYGYDTYKELEDILSEINLYSHDRYVEWDSFYERTSDTFNGTFKDPNQYFDEEILVTICPNAVLRRRKGPALYVNAENVLIECEDCVIDVKSGSHMIFGPYAQDVMIRGIHFKGATETSVRFPYDGAEVYFEDCFFSLNSSRGKHIGTVADVNSTSSVDFMRCLMEKDADIIVATSSLSIRTKGEDG